MRTFAVIENNKVVNIVVDIEDEVVAANSDKYIEYTNDNPICIGYIYNPKWKVFGPAGLVYEPIKQQWITPEEMAAI